MFDEKDTRIWKVSFPRGSTLRSFVLGDVPPGATEEVKWQGFGARQSFVVSFTTEDGETPYQGFVLEDLVGGRIRFHEKNMTLEQFAEESRCA